MLNKIKIILILKLQDKINDDNGIITNDNIDAREEYFLINAIISQHKIKIIPKI